MIWMLLLEQSLTHSHSHSLAWLSILQSMASMSLFACSQSRTSDGMQDEGAEQPSGIGKPTQV